MTAATLGATELEWPITLTPDELAFLVAAVDAGSPLVEKLGLPVERVNGGEPIGMQSLVARRFAGFGETELVLDARVLAVGAALGDPDAAVAILMDGTAGPTGGRIVEGSGVRLLVRPRFPGLHLVSLLDAEVPLADVIRTLVEGVAADYTAIGIEIEIRNGVAVDDRLFLQSTAGGFDWVEVSGETVAGRGAVAQTDAVDVVAEWLVAER